MPTQRTLYPGANSAYGFYNRFDQIWPLCRARRVWVLKGGPGVGKSTFMRRLGQHLQDRGYSIEQFVCSSDNDSLDGLLAPEIGVLLLDGTAPHVVDPRLPGAVDGILNLGAFLNEEALAAQREEIAALTRGTGESFARAYRILRAANNLRVDSAALLRAHVDEGRLCDAANRLANAYLPARSSAGQKGERKLFVSAITPAGCVNALSGQPAQRRVAVTGLWAAPCEAILRRIRCEALARGFFVESFWCALDPKRLEHVRIEEPDLLFYTVNAFHGLTLPADHALDLNGLIPVPTAAEREWLTGNEAMFQQLLGDAVACLSSAKAQHDALEALYTKHMDFAGVDRMLQGVKERIHGIIENADSFGDGAAF